MGRGAASAHFGVDPRSALSPDCSTNTCKLTRREEVEDGTRRSVIIHDRQRNTWPFWKTSDPSSPSERTAWPEGRWLKQLACSILPDWCFNEWNNNYADIFSKNLSLTLLSLSFPPVISLQCYTWQQCASEVGNVWRMVPRDISQLLLKSLIINSLISYWLWFIPGCECLFAGLSHSVFLDSYNYARIIVLWVSGGWRVCFIYLCISKLQDSYLKL